MLAESAKNLVPKFFDETGQRMMALFRMAR